MNTSSLSPGCVTTVCVCEPRQVCTRRDQLGRLHVRDVEDADAAHAILAHRIGHAAEAAVGAAAVRFRRHEQQVLVDRDVVLRRRAVVALRQRRLFGVRDVEDVEAVVVALDRVLAGEGQVRVRRAERLVARRRRRNHVHVPRCLAGVPPAGLQADARIGRRHRRRDDRRHGLRQRLRRIGRRGRRCAAASAASGCGRRGLGAGRDLLGHLGRCGRRRRRRRLCRLRGGRRGRRRLRRRCGCRFRWCRRRRCLGRAAARRDDHRQCARCQCSCDP